MSREASYLVVEVDGERFGLDTGRILTVTEYRQPEPIPGRPAPFLGALNHRGELLPVVHLASVLGRRARVDPLRSVVVVVGWEDGLLGILVERTHGLLTPLARVRTAQVLGRWDGPFLERTLEAEGQRIHVLDLEALLAHVAERVA